MLSPMRSPIKAAITSAIKKIGGWTPGALRGLVQWFLDGTGYSSTTLQSRPVLASRAGISSAVPRGARCYLFDGTDDYCVTGSAVTFAASGNWSVSARIKISSYADYNDVFSFGDSQSTGFAFSIEQTTGLILYVDASNGAGTSFGTTLPLNTTTTLTFVKSGAFITLYVNGASVGTLTAGTTASSGLMHVGAIVYLSTVYKRGTKKLFDVRLYSVAKTAGEVLAIHNQPLTPTSVDTAGLQALWPCQEESGSIGYDVSGNGRHLTLTNVTQSTFHATDAGVTWSYPNEKGHSYYRLITATGGTDYSIANTWIGGTTLSGDFTYSYRLQAAVGNGVFGVGTETTAGGSHFNNMDFGLQYVGVGFVRVWVNGGFTDHSMNWSAGDVLTISRIGSVISLYQNGTFVVSKTVNTSTMYPAFTLGATANTVVGISSTESDYSQVASASVSFGDWVIPASLVDPTKDVYGVSVLSSGAVKLQPTTEVRCVTGDGANVGVNLSASWIPPSGDFSFSIRYFHVSSATAHSVIDQRALDNTQYLGIYVNFPGQDECTLFWSTAVVNGSVKLSGGWNDLRVTRVGNLFSLYVNDLLAGSATATPIIPVANTYLLAVYLGSLVNHSPGRVSDFQITVGGITTYFPLQDGPGTNSNNRSIAYVRSDGTGGMVSSAIVGGTVSSIWANSCPTAQDWSVRYGGSIVRNLASYTESMETALTNGTIGAAGITYTANSVNSPVGTLTADTLAIPLVNGGGNASVGFMGFSDLVGGRIYTASIYIRGALGGESIWIMHTPDGSTFARTLCNLTTSWQRFSVTFTAAAGSTNYFQIGVDTRDSSQAARGAQTVYAWGLQVESGSVATEYQRIPGVSALGAFVAGAIGSANDALGTTKGLPAGKLSNPYSRVVPNNWGAPALNNIGYTSSIKLEEVPCITGNGSDAYVDLGSPLIPASGDFSVSFWYKIKGLQYSLAFSQGTTYANNILVWESPNNVFQVYFNSTAYQGSTSFTTGTWVYVTLTRVGSGFTLVINGTTELTFSNSALVGQSNTQLFKLWDGTYGGSSLSDFRVNAGGTTKYFPLTEGAGRDLAYLQGGSFFVLSNAIIGGSTSSIWANKTPGSFAVAYGPECMLPRFTKFRRLSGDRYLATLAPLTGTDLTNATRYTL